MGNGDCESSIPVICALGGIHSLQMSSESKASHPKRFKSPKGFKRFKKQKKTAFMSTAAIARKGHEVKTVDTNLQTTTPTNTLAAVLLNGCTEGTDAVNRIGRRINMKSVRIRMLFAQTRTIAAAVQPTFVRYALVYDRQPNGAAPAWADVFQTINASGTTESNALSHPNPTNFDRFIVMREGMRSYVPTTTSANEPTQEAGNKQEAVENWFVLLKDLEANYIAGAGAGTIADFRSGSLYMLFLSNVTAANQFMDCIWSARVRFRDQ